MGDQTKTVVVSVIISLVLAILIVAVWPLNSISKLGTRVDALESSNTQLVTSLNDSLSQLTTSFNNLQSQLNTSVQTVDKNQSAALTAAVASLNNDISAAKALVQAESTQRAASETSLTNSINTINTSLSSVSDRVSDLETSVADLEDSSSSSTSGLDAEIRSTDGLNIDAGETYFSGTTVVRITNDSSYDMDSIDLSIWFTADEDIQDISSAYLSGGSTSWTFEGQDGNTLYFSNVSGFSVDSGEYKQMTLTLTVYFDGEVYYDTTFDPSVSITDYDY
jgi:methyl-accepting chemotaxis protein